MTDLRKVLEAWATIKAREYRRGHGVTNKYFEVLVDPEAFESLNKYTWRVTTNKAGIPASIYRTQSKSGHKRSVQIGQEIIGAKAGYYIDHINRNPLDNRRKNLRHVTPKQNAMNRSAIRSKTLKGVSWNTRKSRWAANIMADGKNVFHGLYPSQLEAALAYDNFVRVFHGEFAVTNFAEDTLKDILSKIGTKWLRKSKNT